LDLVFGLDGEAEEDEARLEQEEVVWRHLGAGLL